MKKKGAGYKSNLFWEDIDIMNIFQNEIRKVEDSLEKINEIYKKNLCWFDRISDQIAQVGGSWSFIITFFVILGCWVATNTIIMVAPFDPYPFELLNVFLSCLAAIQAPIILMAQNRAAKRDQARAEMDLEKDLRDLKIDQKSLEILTNLQKDINLLKKRKK